MNTGSDITKGITQAKEDLTSSIVEEVAHEEAVVKETTYNVFDSITQTIAQDTQSIYKAGQDISNEILRTEQTAEETLEGVIDEAGQEISGVAGQIVSKGKGLANIVEGAGSIASSPNTILIVGGITILALILM